MVGKNISHYKIIEKLGEGGMGEVYLAEDTKLERKVAIKFLPQHLTKDKENVERFEREAKAAASLNHPNIVTIYEISEENDQIFIVMEYVDGKSLRDVLNEYKLRIDKVIDIFTQISEGLSRAHQAGIVHRDIKPENIMVGRDARIRILDFGLAKLKGVSKLTKESSTLGTVHYMSPEQIQGRQVDQRSDIWSLGVLLYEMLTGEVPFQGDYEQAVTYDILNEEPKLLKEIESKYSPEMSSIITKIISKERENRYQNCLDLIDDLKRESDVKPQRKKSLTKSIYAIAGVIAITILIILSILYFYPREIDEASLKSLAVLPFINEIDDPETDWLGMSLAYDIIGGLSYIQNIIVRPSNSVQVYKDKTVDRESAGKELDVDFIFSGNHMKEGNIIRLNVELINVHENKIIWHEKIDEQYVTKFKLIDAVSEKLIKRLKIKLTSQEHDRMTSDIPKDTLAYDYYLRAVAFPLSVEGAHHSISILNQAKYLDSTYAPIFSEIGYRLQYLAQHELGSSNLYAEAEKYYRKSLEINPELLSALSELARLYVDLGKSEEAIVLAKKALSLNPNYPMTHHRLSYLYRYTGMLDESKKEVEMTLKLDPTNVRFRSSGQTYLYLGEYSKALKAYELGGESSYTFEKKGEIYFREDKGDLALDYFNRAINIEPFALTAVAVKAYIEQNRVEGLKIAWLWEQSDPHDSEVLYELASIYGLFAEKKRCSYILRKAVEGGFFCFPFMLRDEFLDPVRNDPEFQEVLALAKEKHEAFKQRYFAEKE